MRSVHLLVRGRVQGVGYRAFLEREAAHAALSGWVRNRSDGSVEAMLAGAQDAVEQVVQACRRGPPSARVSAVDVAPVAGSAVPIGRFMVLPTA